MDRPLTDALWPEVQETKLCYACKVTLPLSEFARNRKHLDGLSRRCRQCTKQYATHYRSENRERTAFWLKRSGLARKYQLTPAEWEAMLANQEGKCPICRLGFDPAVPACNAMVDHDHTTGNVQPSSVVAATP